jgi:hypothetical protein
MDQISPDCALGSTTKQHTVREDACAFAGALEGAEDVQQLSVIALLAWRDAVVLEALPGVVLGIEARAPALVAEGWIGNDVVEGLERVSVEIERAGDSVTLFDLRRGVVVQDLDMRIEPTLYTILGVHTRTTPTHDEHKRQLQAGRNSR